MVAFSSGGVASLFMRSHSAEAWSPWLMGRAL